MPYATDNSTINFDSYLNDAESAWVSSDAGSNFQLKKTGDKFSINYDSGVAVDSTITWNTAMTFDTSGNVGIGTTGPSAALDVVTNDNVWTGEFTQSNTSNGDGVIVQVGSTASADYALSIRSDAGNTSVIAAKADGKVGIGTFTPAQLLTVEGSAIVARLGSSSIYHEFNSANGILNFVQSSSPLARFQVNGTDVMSMNETTVGIGTTSPAKPLHISSSDNQPLRVESTDAYSGIELKDNGSATLPPLISALSDDFIFYGGHASSRPAIMFMDSSTGNVGIGTASPSKVLHVSAGGTNVGAVDYDVAIFQNSDAAGIRLVDAGDGGGNGGHAGFGNDNGNLRTSAAGILTFATGLSTSNSLFNGGTERMRISATGKASWSAGGIGAVATQARDFTFYTEGVTNGCLLYTSPSPRD